MTELDAFKIIVIAAYWVFMFAILVLLGLRVQRHVGQSFIGKYDLATLPLSIRWLPPLAGAALFFFIAYCFLFLIYPPIQYEYLPIGILQQPGVTYLGALLILLGLIVLLLAQWTLGPSYRLLLPEGEIQLSMRGIYKFTRNPIYLGNSLALLGIVLMLPDWTLLIALLIIIANNHLRIREEEKYLSDKFGTVYQQYCRQVGRYL